MATCHGLASRGHDVTLAVRWDPRRPHEDPFAFYGLPPLPRLAIRRVRLPLTGPIQRGGFLAYSLGSMVGGSRWDLLFTRDLGIADSCCACHLGSGVHSCTNLMASRRSWPK